jgi:hypothetical protein
MLPAFFRMLVKQIKGFVSFLCAVPRVSASEGWEIRFAIAVVAYLMALELIWDWVGYCVDISGVCKYF